jgi:hypothetical protein
LIEITGVSGLVELQEVSFGEPMAHECGHPSEKYWTASAYNESYRHGDGIKVRQRHRVRRRG